MGDQALRTVHLPGGTAHLLGTIPGWVADRQRVESAWQQVQPSAVALAIPPEDLEGLQALHDHPELAEELPELDGPEKRFHDLLGGFGPTRIPSPDLETAHRLAHEAGVPVVAVDMDDETHTTVYTRYVKTRHLWGRSKVQARLMERDFSAATDAYDLALRWDQVQTAYRPLATVEAAREAVMAAGIQESVADHGDVLVVVHVARLEGVQRRLEQAQVD